MIKNKGAHVPHSNVLSVRIKMADAVPRVGDLIAGGYADCPLQSHISGQLTYESGVSAYCNLAKQFMERHKTSSCFIQNYYFRIKNYNGLRFRKNKLSSFLTS